MATNQTINNTLNTNPIISEDWNGGYKLELGIQATGNANNWSIDFELPYNISAAYGVDLVNNGDGSYTINGQNDQVSLQDGQSIQPIFIIEDYGQEATAPQIININIDGDSDSNSPDLLEEPISQPVAEEIAPPITDESTLNIPESDPQSVGQQGQYNRGNLPMVKHYKKTSSSSRPTKAVNSALAIASPGAATRLPTTAALSAKTLKGVTSMLATTLNSVSPWQPVSPCWH